VSIRQQPDEQKPVWHIVLTQEKRVCKDS